MLLLAGCNAVFGLEPTDLAGDPVAFGQVNAVQVFSAGSASVAFLSPLMAHDAVVACVFASASTVNGVSDSQNNTYTPVLGPVPLMTTPSGNLYLYMALDVVGGADTVTVAADTISPELLVYIHEYSNVAGVDVAASGMGGDSTGTTDGITSGLVDTHYENELIFGFATTGTALPGTGFFARSNLAQNVTEDRTVRSPGRYAATATMTAGDGWTILMAALYAR